MSSFMTGDPEQVIQRQNAADKAGVGSFLRTDQIRAMEVATQVERSLGVLNEVDTGVVHAVQNRPLS